MIKQGILFSITKSKHHEGINIVTCIYLELCFSVCSARTGQPVVKEDPIHHQRPARKEAELYEGKKSDAGEVYDYLMISASL